jgi:hypothetical protein
MSLNGISNATATYDTKTKVTKAKEEKNSKSTVSSSSQADDTAAVYEPGSTDYKVQDSTKTIYKRDNATIEQLKADADKRTAQLRELVEKLLLKQGKTFDDSTDMYKLLREGKLDVDPETAAKAQADIAEDGYWGVEQTSDRLYSFAIALSGGDPDKADTMIEAVKKGFKQATKAWGDNLPDICQKTLDRTMEKLNKWKETGNSDLGNSSATDAAKTTDSVSKTN